MELGAITETVNVQAAAPLVNAVSAEQNQTFESVKVTDLPLARRNVSNILGIGTGVSRSTTQHGTLRLNGLGQGGTGISLDGTEASGNPEGRSAGMFQNFNQVDLVSIDAVQEVQVIKGVAQAEYGRAVGGQINVITRSGTNEFHGSLFENFQAENLNARNQTLPNKPGATFNQFGASAGGRVIRDRIFFFSAYEGYRDASFRVVSGDMPTPRTRAEVLAAVPSYDLALRILPLPNQPYAADAVTGFYQSAATFRGRDNTAMAKGDFRIGNSGNLAMTYGRMRPFQVTPRVYPNGADDQTHKGMQERATVNFIAGGAAWTSETRFGLTVNDMTRVDTFFDKGIDTTTPEQTSWGRRIGAIKTNLGWSTPDTETRPLEGVTWSALAQVRAAFRTALAQVRRRVRARGRLPHQPPKSGLHVLQQSRPAQQPAFGPDSHVRQPALPRHAMDSERLCAGRLAQEPLPGYQRRRALRLLHPHGREAHHASRRRTL